MKLRQVWVRRVFFEMSYYWAWLDGEQKGFGETPFCSLHRWCWSWRKLSVCSAFFHNQQQWSSGAVSSFLLPPYSSSSFSSHSSYVCTGLTRPGWRSHVPKCQRAGLLSASLCRRNGNHVKGTEKPLLYFKLQVFYLHVFIVIVWICRSNICLFYMKNI